MEEREVFRLFILLRSGKAGLKSSAYIGVWQYVFWPGVNIVLDLHGSLLLLEGSDAGMQKPDGIIEVVICHTFKMILWDEEGMVV